jgi:hypothetical protein
MNNSQLQIQNVSGPPAFMERARRAKRVGESLFWPRLADSAAPWSCVKNNDADRGAQG